MPASLDAYDDAPIGSPPDKDIRQEYIADLMVKGRYRTRVTARVLAENWGIGYRTIENDASDASRMLRISPEKRAEYQAQQQAFFEAQQHRAATMCSNVTGLPDFKAALAAAELACKYAGIAVEPEAGAAAPTQHTIQIVYPSEPEKPESK